MPLPFFYLEIEMAKTLLKVVQLVLSDMGEDAVSSIYDSEEAKRVADMATAIYSSILTEYPWVIKRGLITPKKIQGSTIFIPDTSQRVTIVKYAASGKCSDKCDSTPGTKDGMYRIQRDDWFQPQDDCKPHRRKAIEEMVPCLDWTGCVPNVYLNTNYVPAQDPRKSCVELTYQDLEEFLARCHYHEDDCNDCDECPIKLHDDEYKIKIRRDKDPEFWTVIDGNVVLDSYCYKDGSRIQEQRLMIIGETSPEIKVHNHEKIDLPQEFYNYFLAELKSTAHYAINERPNEKEESRSQRLRRSLRRAHGLQGKTRTSVEYDYGTAWRR